MKVIVKNLNDVAVDVFGKSDAPRAYTIKTLAPRDGVEYEFEDGDSLCVRAHVDQPSASMDPVAGGDDESDENTQIGDQSSGGGNTQNAQEETADSAGE